MSSGENEKPLPRPKPRGVKSSKLAGTQPPADAPELPVPAKRQREASTKDTDPGRYEATIANQGETPPARDSASAQAATQGGHASQGRYEMVQRVASGGMGEVWLAKDRNFRDRFVAIKRLKKEYRDDAAMRARFESEAESLSRLVHIHTIRVFDCGRDSDGPFISMEFVSGPERPTDAGWPSDLPQKPLNLDEHVTSNGCYSPAAAVQILLKLCRAVSEAHAMGIIHRDLKPANVLLDANFEPKLIDFGLARDLHPEDTQHTMAGSQLLTLGYGAPEQEVDSSQADHRADIYALGGILWFLISGQNPRFYRDSDVPSELREVVARCLERDRSLRFHSVTELQDALANLNSAGRPAGTGRTAVDSSDAAQELTRIATALDRPRTAGTCPMCGHVHSPVPTSRRARQFCSGCGSNLWLKCTQCDSKSSAFSLKASPAIPLWDRFCSRCGEDLVGPAISHLKGAGQALKDAKSANVADIATIRRHTEKTRTVLDALAQLFGAEFEAGRVGEVVRAARVELTAMQSGTMSRELSNDEQLWSQACEGNSPEAYGDYLKHFAAGQHAAEAQHRIFIFTLAASIRQRLKDKAYRDLTPAVRKLIRWSPAVAKEWPDAKLWSLAKRDGTPEACFAYLEIYPDGQGSPNAKEVASPELRRRLLVDMNNRVLRETYLRYRSESDEAEDESRAFNSTILMATVIGVICAIPSALIGLNGLNGPAFLWAAVFLPPAGLLLGLQLSFFSGRYAKHGPLPRLSYLQSESLAKRRFRDPGAPAETSTAPVEIPPDSTSA